LASPFGRRPLAVAGRCDERSIRCDQRSTVERLAAAGATIVAAHSVPSGFTWTVLQDAVGNEFCVAVEP
jgi:hypothetical protein